MYWISVDMNRTNDWFTQIVSGTMTSNQGIFCLAPTVSEPSFGWKIIINGASDNGYLTR